MHVCVLEALIGLYTMYAFFTICFTRAMCFVREFDGSMVWFTRIVYVYLFVYIFECFSALHMSIEKTTASL